MHEGLGKKEVGNVHMNSTTSPRMKSMQQVVRSKLNSGSGGKNVTLSRENNTNGLAGDWELSVEFPIELILSEVEIYVGSQISHDKEEFFGVK